MCIRDSLQADLNAGKCQAICNRLRHIALHRAFFGHQQRKGKLGSIFILQAVFR